MSKRVLRAASLGVVGLVGIVLVTFMTNQREALANPPVGDGVLMGDLNQDGVANNDDLGPFVQAMLDPAAWQAEYGLTASEMLALADFDGDGQVTVADRTGFCQAIASSGTGTSGGALPPGGAVDLDIDSDNNNHADYPDRTAAEDGVELTAPGKYVGINDDDDDANTTTDKDQPGAVAGEDDLRPIVLEITPDPTANPAVVPITDWLDYKLTYNTNVLVWRDPERGAAGQQVLSTTTYSQRVWIRGDMNADGVFNFDDIDPFIQALGDFATWKATYLSAYPDMDERAADIGDFTGDRVINADDTVPFATALGIAATYVPVYMWVEGLQVDAHGQTTQISVDADTDKDTVLDAADAVLALTVLAPGLGAAPAWGAEVGISPFSSVNLQNGNVLTAIPLVGWDPVGPPVQFTLYHNSGVGASGTDHAAWGFDLGDGWSVSYGAYIVGDWGDSVVFVVHGDGSRDAYTYDSVNDEYIAPTGVYSRLTFAGGMFRLTTPNQTQFRFSQGKLGYIYENGGLYSRRVSISRSSGKLYSVTSAAHGLPDPDGGTVTHRLTFQYTGDKLSSVTDPMGRVWSFEYETGGSERLTAIVYPTDQYYPSRRAIEIGYETSTNRIGSITSRDGKEWLYHYSRGKLSQVEDPVHDLGGGQTSRETQAFAYATTPDDGLWTTTYTDRRSKGWMMRFDGAENVREVLAPMTNPNNPYTLTYDDQHNVLSATNELGHTWTYTYGPVGNVQTIVSPLTGGDAQTWTLTWEQPDPTGRPNLYRLTQLNDPEADGVGEYTIKYRYTITDHPTLVTEIEEPPAGSGGNPAITTIDYYLSPTDPASHNRQVKLVTDANGVEHAFEYDKWGYMNSLTEGLHDGTGRSVTPAPVLVKPIAGPLGQQDGTAPGDSSGTHGELCYDADMQPRSDCVICRLYRALESGVLRLGSVPSWEYSPGHNNLDNIEYDNVGRVTALDHRARTIWLDQTYHFRRNDWTYDDLGRMTELLTSSGVYSRGGPDAWSELRSFSVPAGGYDEAGNLLALTGPDGMTTSYTYDDNGRVTTIARGSMGVVYHYDAADRLELVENTDSVNVISKAVRHYDAANRLEWIEHRDAADTPLLRVEYVWNRDNTVARRTEIEYAGGLVDHTAVVTFEYDARKRLTRETRVLDTTTTVYDLGYTYDQLGNRKSKHDLVNDWITWYVHDTDWDPQTEQWMPGLPFTPDDPAYATRNNRLVEYRLYGEEQIGGARDLIQTVKYVYYETGHVSNIIVKDEYPGTGDPSDYEWYYDVALYYNANGQLFRALWDRWKIDGGHTIHSNLYARDFLYDSPRALYGVVSYAWGGGRWEDQSVQKWTDYVGVQPYRDFDLITVDGDPPITTDDTERYLAGFGTHALQTLDGVNDPIRYLHGDLIRSTMLTSDETGQAVERMAYAALGEPVTLSGVGGDLPGGFPRYGYAGGWGPWVDRFVIARREWA